MVTSNRFAYRTNLARATGYRMWRSAFWPPAPDYRVFCLDLAPELPALGAALGAELEILRAAIDAEWRRVTSLGGDGATRLHDATTIARCLHRLAELLPGDDDRRALVLRAEAVEHGYDEDSLQALKRLDEEITFVAGRLSTWYGKQTGGLPTAFGCIRDAGAQASVTAAVERLDDVAAYLRALHSGLRLGPVPAFSAARLFFMAGEGNRHPKHIAYFLPEDEGVKRSPFKRTYYFANTHRALIDAVSLPLARRRLVLGTPLPADAAGFGAVPTLGVLAHEMGHFVHREGAGFSALNAADRWASIMLQETAADVFGTLVLAQVFAPALGLDPADVVSYHLGECLRYVDRGLGHFPDSDGMFLQLNYLASFGALRLEPDEVRLAGDPDVVVAGFRSLARVLGDTLLAGEVERTLALYRTYGPAGGERLRPLVEALHAEPFKTIEYLQEPQAAAVKPTATGASLPKPTPSDTLREFYCTPIGAARNRYDIWERGGACGDSVTPSTYCPEYRTHMILKMLSLPRSRDRVFSIGCGNAFVEAGLLARGLRVQAIDCNEEAVVLALSKGIEAFTADYEALPPGHLAEFGIVYADGLLGHLYRPDSGLDGFFETLLRLAPPPGSWLVLSNDAPARPGTPVTPHGGLAGFWLFSRDYLSESVARFGFSVTECYSFPYERPVSGLRERTICIARAGAGAVE